MTAHPKVPPERFVRVWEASVSRAQVAEILGTTSGAVGTRAAKYRKRGVPLKKFPRGVSNGPFNVAALSRLVAKNGKKE